MYDFFVAVVIDYLLIYPLLKVGLKKKESRISESHTIIILLSLSPVRSASVCFVYIDVLLFGLYILYLPFELTLYRYVWNLSLMNVFDLKVHSV